MTTTLPAGILRRPKKSDPFCPSCFEGRDEDGDTCALCDGYGFGPACWWCGGMVEVRFRKPMGSVLDGACCDCMNELSDSGADPDEFFFVNEGEFELGGEAA